MNIDVFPQDERELRTKLVTLMEDWKREVAPSQIVSRGDGETYSGASYFCPDGFFPYYTHQKYKILFVARELVSAVEFDYIEVLYRDHGGDSKPFRNRQFELAYGILHDGTVSYGDKPGTQELRRTFAQEGGISFAFMELSKYCNDASDGGKRRDSALMTRFLQDSHLDKRNFFQEELSLLDPDIILTMNLWDGAVPEPLLETAFYGVRFVEQSNPYVQLKMLPVNGRKVPLLDLYHFSIPGTSEAWFYNPVMQVWKDWKVKQKYP